MSIEFPALPEPGAIVHASRLAAAEACGCAEADLPAPLLEVHVDMTADAELPLASLGVGFEQRRWRAGALARHIVEWVPDFALRPSERSHLSAGRVVERLRRAYQATFGDGADRGVPAEILLHAICRERYGSSTVVNKVYFKTSDNDTYKGFDGVHCVHAQDGGIELWLGEAKFYSNLTVALRAAAHDLEGHVNAGYLRREFALVSSKIDDSHPHLHEMQSLLHANRRLEDVFKRVVIPLFVSYNSRATASSCDVTATYLHQLQAEAEAGWKALQAHVRRLREQRAEAGDPVVDLNMEVRLFLLPMASKQELLDELNKAVSSWRL